MAPAFLAPVLQRRRIPRQVAAEPLLEQVDVRSVAGQQVGLRPVNVAGAALVLGHVRVRSVQAGLVEHRSRARVQAVQADPAVEERGPPGRHVRDGARGLDRRVALNQHAAVDGPRRFHLTERRDAPVLRSSQETPHLAPVGQAQAVDPPVGRAEQDQVAMHRRR